MKPYLICITYLLYLSCNAQIKDVPFNFETGVLFKTSDSLLQNIFDSAERKAKLNISKFGKYEVLVEGGGYNNVWLETQPMGGYMYAKRNLTIARNNTQIFMDYQRQDGRLPGMIVYDKDKFDIKYGWFQGFCYAMPAYELYYWLGKDRQYLEQVYNSLEKFDNYLWKTRDSDHNGCLETWCIWDTGEDECERFHGFPNAWPFDYPPSKETIKKFSPKQLEEYCYEKNFDTNTVMPVPIESMDIMSYSYTCRDVLSLISDELKNGKKDFWRKKAEAVKKKIKIYLWDPTKGACYDKDFQNKTMNILLHNNLRCMYFGSFDQQMADVFVKQHLMNPEEFWTHLPLPSIAVNDPYFKNIAGNNWSGQPQGLTYQRSIEALENYGHLSELTLIGKKFLNVIGKSLKFTQQFDPFTGAVNNTSDGYGPSILTSLEFISRFYGVHLTKDKIFWSCLDEPGKYQYTQKWNGHNFKLETKENIVRCIIDDQEILSFTKGVRVVTDLSGNIIEMQGLESAKKDITINYKNKLYKIKAEPNTSYRLNDKGQFYTYRSVEYSGTYK